MKTLRYILLRLLQAVPVLLGVSIVTFALMVATPGDPIRLLVGDRATPETIALIRDRYGLDDPILAQYVTYLRNLLQGDLGASLRYRVPVSQLIAQHYPVTLFLVIYTIVLTLPPVIALSVWSARRQSGVADQVIRLLGVVGLAVPVFWLALLFARFFGVTLGWFPVSGFGNSFGEHLLHLFLPALSTMIAAAYAGPSGPLREGLLEGDAFLGIPVQHVADHNADGIIVGFLQPLLGLMIEGLLANRHGCW